MKTLPKTLEGQLVIRFQDCDPFRHLNNSKYIDYCFNAREDQLQAEYNLSVFGLAKEKGISWVVGQNQIAYLRPALVMETVVVQSQLISLSNKVIQVEYRMLNQEKTEIKLLMWAKFVHFSLKEQRAVSHDEELQRLFEQILLPVPEKSFEERVATIRAGNL